MSDIFSLFEDFTYEPMDAETFLSKLKSTTEFDSLDSLLPHYADSTNFPVDRLFRAVSIQLDKFWLPERQKVEHEDKQDLFDVLCWLLQHYMTKSPGDVVDQVECETLEKLFRSLAPFLVLNFDDSTDVSNWTPKCVYLKSLLWQFAFYDNVQGKYKQNQTKLITSIIGLMEKVNQAPECEFNNLFSDTYSSVELKDRFMGALAFVLNRFEWCKVDLMDHLEFDRVLFACYSFMQHYAGDNLWSLNLEALGRVRTLVHYIADKLSNEIFEHITFIESDLTKRKLKLSSVVLVQYLSTLKLVPLECTFENIRLDISDEVEMAVVKDAGEEEGGEVRSDETEGGDKETNQENDEVDESSKVDYEKLECEDEDDEVDEDYVDDGDYDEDGDCDEKDWDEEGEEYDDEEDVNEEMESETEMKDLQSNDDESEKASSTPQPTALNTSISSSLLGFW